MTVIIVLKIFVAFIAAIALTVITMEVFHTGNRWVWHVASFVYFVSLFLIFCD